MTTSKTKKFKVLIKRTEHYSTEIEVEAKSEKEAKEIAEQEADENLQDWTEAWDDVSVKSEIVDGRKDGKGAKNVRYGYSYVDGGDSCDGFPQSGRRLYDTPEKAKRAMVADARFYAKANEIDPDEIVESKFCTDYRCEIKDRCVWQTFKVEC